MALTGIQVGARTAARAATLHLRAGARWGHVRRLRERERERTGGDGGARVILQIPRETTTASERLPCDGR